MRIIILSSSVVEQSAVNRFVVGSIPTWGGAEYLVGLVAQWTRARGYELRCRGFESLLARRDHADVAELVDARDLGSRVFGVRVRVSPSVF